MSSEDDDLARQRLGQLLESLNLETSLIGYMVTNQSGGIVLADLPADIDAELISLRFLGIAKNSSEMLSELERGKLHCISLQTEEAQITAFAFSEYWIVMLGPHSSREKQFTLFEKTLSQIKEMAEKSDIQLQTLALEASKDLQTLLKEIDTIKGVIGCVIVGHDGLLIANSMPEEIDAESIGIWSMGEYMNTEHVMKKLGHERIHQIVNRTPRGYVVVADFGSGLLVTVTEWRDVENLIPLMRKITDLMS